MKNRIIFYSLLLFLISGALYFHNNTAQVYAQIGNFYYNHNNVKKAQFFYEKSFRLGNRDRTAREVYVNSIINSPLTIDAQEKLVMLADGEVQDSASNKAKNFLSELKREIHNKYPQNYIKQAPYNQQIVRWNHFPITYSYKNKNVAPAEYIDEINKAFSEWERNGNIMFSENSDNGDILITFINQLNNKTLDYGKKYIVAYTEPQITGNSLRHMNVYFYIQNPEGVSFTRNQIYNTALHEIFHALGFMGHSFDPKNIMYLAKNGKKFLEDGRESLTEDDITTLRLLYKIKPDITNSDELLSEYIPYLVLGDNSELNSSKFREAKNYIYHAPTLPSGYIDLAESLVAKKRYSDAIKCLEKALDLAESDDTRYIVFYNLAVSYYYINHYEMVLYYIDKAFAIRDEEELHQLKAEALRKNDLEGSKKEYRYLINLAPDNPDYITQLANIYIEEKSYLKARKLLKDFLKRNPKYRDDKRFLNYGILII